MFTIATAIGLSYFSTGEDRTFQDFYSLLVPLISPAQGATF
jgi:hypothetical protein